jgi:hypothetical protein
MEKLFRLLLVNLAYALDATTHEREVAYVEEEPLDMTADLEGETDDKEEKKPAAKKDEKKSTPNPKRKVYTKDEPAKTKVEKELYMIQWAELGKKGLQEDYLAGKVDSLGNALESADEDDDFADFGEVEEEKAEFTADQVRDALKAYAKDNGKDEAYKVLAQFGAKKIADIKEKDFSDVMAEIL